MVGIEQDISTCVAYVSAPRLVHPRYAKTSACKEREATELCYGNAAKVFLVWGDKHIDLFAK